MRVYPRPCGGTDDIEISARPDEGLSPPVRGNPASSAMTYSIYGSIPARAGEPEHRWHAPRYSRVYPRPCGGT